VRRQRSAGVLVKGLSTVDRLLKLNSIDRSTQIKASRQAAGWYRAREDKAKVHRIALVTVTEGRYIFPHPIRARGPAADARRGGATVRGATLERQ
jgi:hypothetical protein